MDFLTKCRDRFDSLNSVLSVGLDPIIEKFPITKNGIKETIIFYFSEILEHFQNKIYVVKPNIAFYEQYGLDGLIALKEIIKLAKKLEIPVILDCKRGDIGNTAKVYAKACFNEFEADAVTLSPYLGLDSLSPFFEYKEKGHFVLALTSNKGSGDFQKLSLNNGTKLYEKVFSSIVDWNNTYSNNIGAVIGATHIDDFRNILNRLERKSIPLLIPGVGTQGGSFVDIINLLKEFNYPLYKIFINSSSKIIYANEEHKSKNYLDDISLEIKKMELK